MFDAEARRQRSKKRVRLEALIFERIEGLLGGKPEWHDWDPGDAAEWQYRREPGIILHKSEFVVPACDYIRQMHSGAKQFDEYVVGMVRNLQARGYNVAQYHDEIIVTGKPNE